MEGKKTNAERLGIIETNIEHMVEGIGDIKTLLSEHIAEGKVDKKELTEMFLTKGYKKAIATNTDSIRKVKDDVHDLEQNVYNLPDKFRNIFANIWVETVMKSVIVAVLIAGVVGGYKLIF